MLGKKLWYDFSNENDWDAKISKLIDSMYYSLLRGEARGRGMVTSLNLILQNYRDWN